MLSPVWPLTPLITITFSQVESRTLSLRFERSLFGDHLLELTCLIAGLGHSQALPTNCSHQYALDQELFRFRVNTGLVEQPWFFLLPRDPLVQAWHSYTRHSYRFKGLCFCEQRLTTRDHLFWWKGEQLYKV